ncbi:MAG: sodium/solute symporter [Planctomycetes bacterium]|nr:sodium/solute symporter [Planctomycetota bacterium]
MDLLDYLVIGGYAVAMLAVGRYYRMRAVTADDFLLGGRRMNPWMIGLSLFATLTSTLSYLAYPGEMIKNGPMMFAQLTAFPVVMLIVGWVLIPRIMREKVTSGYELLESRLGLGGRLLGAVMFMALRTVWMAAILYATTNKIIVPLLGIDPLWAPLISAAMGVVTLIYAAEGGMRAVVVTDALQSFIMFGGAIAIVVVVSVSLGGIAAWWPTEWAPHWQEPVFWFRADVRVTFMGAFLNMVVWMTCTAGADQMAIQRYLSTRDAGAARWSFGIHLLADVAIALLLAVAGLAVLAYFTAHPEVLASERPLLEQADEMLPRFVVDVLPAGVSGLVIAAMLSAAMSSLSSGMNSASAVITTDFIGRYRREKWSPQDEVRVARWASIGVGMIAVLLSTFVGELASNLLELCIKVVNLLTAPLFVLFFLALFVPWARPLGGAAATVASVGVAVGIAFFKLGGLEFLWTGPAAFVAGVVVGSVVSLIPVGQVSGVRDQASRE